MKLEPPFWKACSSVHRDVAALALELDGRDVLEMRHVEHGRGRRRFSGRSFFGISPPGP